MLVFQRQLQLVSYNESHLAPCFIIYNEFIAGDDFNATPFTAIIPAGATNTTVTVAVTDDNIVEGDEVFSMSLTVPSYLGPGIVAGLVTNATVTIIDTSGM